MNTLTNNLNDCHAVCPACGIEHERCTGSGMYTLCKACDARWAQFAVIPDAVPA